MQKVQCEYNFYVNEQNYNIDDIDNLQFKELKTRYALKKKNFKTILKIVRF